MSQVQQPIYTHSEYISHDGFDLEIKGEVFDTPIKKSEAQMLYSRISIFDMESNLYWGIGELFHEKKDLEQLRTWVEIVKNNIEHFKNKD